MANADAHPVKVLTKMGQQAANTVMTGGAAAQLDPDLGRGQINLVIKNKNVLKRDFIEPCSFLNRTTGAVHEGFRFQDKDFVATDFAFGKLAIEAFFEGAKRKIPGNSFNCHKTDVMAVKLVIFAWIS